MTQKYNLQHTNQVIQVNALTEDSWHTFLKNGLSATHLVQNAQLDTCLLSYQGQLFPVTINRVGRADTSWVASLRNAYGPYARAELTLIGMPRWQRPPYNALSRAAEALLQSAGLAGGSFINNWLIATNLYARTFDINAVLTLRDQLLEREPGLPVILRSLTPVLHQQLLADLRTSGFLLIPTRQVWVASELAASSWLRHADVKRDLKLEASAQKTGDTAWVYGPNFTDADFRQSVLLYDHLYRGKYPEYNPAYTEAFFRLAVESGWLNLRGLRDLKTGNLLGIAGIIERDGVFATPVLGYDTSRPAAEGLYRRLMLQAFNHTRTHGGILHCSGGAGSFKRQRGATHHVEYAAVWVQHLSRTQRNAAAVLNTLVRHIAVPYLETHPV